MMELIGGDPINDTVRERVDLNGMAVTTLMTLMKKDLDEHTQQDIIKSATQTNKKCFQYLCREHTNLVVQHAWGVIHSCISDDDIDVIKKMSKYCPSSFDDWFLALQMCVDYDNKQLFQYFYEKTKYITDADHLKQLLILAWEKDAVIQRVNPLNMLRVRGDTTKYIEQKMPIEQLRQCLMEIDDPKICHHLCVVLKNNPKFQDEHDVLFAKHFNATKKSFHDALKQSQRKMK